MAPPTGIGRPTLPDLYAVMMHPPSRQLHCALRFPILKAPYQTSEPASSASLFAPLACHQRASVNPRKAWPFRFLRNLSTATQEHRGSPPPSRLSRQCSPPPYTAALKSKSRHHDPLPKERDAATTTTDLGALDVLADVAAPATAIDACMNDGFRLNNGITIAGGHGCLLVDGEVFAWRPWKGDGNEKGGMINNDGQWEVAEEAWGLLRLLWPKPDLLILGLGTSVYPLSPQTRRHINLLGIRIEVQDTRNAAAQFNLLATERGVREVAAALVPAGWTGR